MKFQVDGAYLGSVEQRQFFEYLDSHFLYIEVWDGDGLFPIGVCGLELRVSDASDEKEPMGGLLFQS